MIKNQKFLQNTITLLVVGAISSAHAAQVRVAAEGVQVVGQQDGTVQICNAKGEPRLNIVAYALIWSPPATDGGVPTRVTTPDGKAALQVTYRLKNDASGKLRVRAQFVPAPQRVQVRYEVWAPATVDVGGAMVFLKSAQPGVIGEIVKPGLWQRAKNGGAPYEISDHPGLFYQWPNASALVSLQKTNLDWVGEEAIHFPPQKVADGHYVAEGEITLLEQKARPSALAALLAKRPVALDIWTDKAFNIWDSNKPDLTLHTSLTNVENDKKPVELSWWARDFNGQVLAQGRETHNLDARGTSDQTLKIKAPARGLVFVEVTAKSGDFSTFKRTNLAVMPPVQFQSGQESTFGMAGFFDLPSQDAVLNLMQRIGVRWLRSTPDNVSVEELKQHGLFTNYHSSVELHGPAEKAPWFADQVKIAEKSGAEYWELGNEWNMDGGIGNAKHAEKYVNELLIPANETRKASGSKVKMMSMGFSGTDAGFLDKIAQLGAWDRFSALAIHVGRGNYTPDFDGKRPGGDEYWSFLGTIREAKAKLKQHGEKPLYVTEAYASTHANHWWTDTQRHSAESVVLSYALAKAEGVRVMDWYQLHDTVWFDQGGVNSEDTEYHFGLLNRDLSPKPSLLGYQTIAQALDGATFVRKLEFPGSKNHGLLFNSPRGPLAVLWNRSDGYVLNGAKPAEGIFAAPETWIDTWKTKIALELPARGAVEIIDAIGQRQNIAPRDGKARLVLDGAPRIVYGLTWK